jgi:recA bacterial DNA recombination protein
MSDDSLATALTTLRRRYGPRALQRGDVAEGVERWATGIPALDAVLPGGLPRGRITVLAAASAQGPSGRLTLLQSLLAVAGRSRDVGYVDLPGSVDPGFLADLGADLDALLVVTPGSGRWGRGLAMARSLVLAGLPWLGIALDRAAPPRGWDAALAALAEAVSARQAVCIVAAPAPLARPLAHAASVVLTCQAVGWHRARGDVTGLRVSLTTTKCKVGAPGGSTALLLRYPRPYAVAEVLGLPTVVTPRLQPAGSEALPAVAAVSGG